MNRQEIEANIGHWRRINRDGDLAFDADLKPIIGKYVQVIKLTKGGMVEVAFCGVRYQVPPRNVDVL